MKLYCNYIILFLFLTSIYYCNGQTYTRTSTTYSWVDISSSGTAVSSTTCDDCNYYLTLPFSFNFYGNNYTDCYVSSNGKMTFGAGWSTAANQCLPNATNPNNLIAAYWDDLYFDYSCAPTYFKYQTFGSSPNRIYIVSWIAFRAYGGSCGTYVYSQIKLFETSNNIEVHLNSNALGSSGTIGIENSGGTLGDYPICNSATTNGTAWLWSPCSAPTTQASNITFATQPNCTSIGVSWTNGNGSKRIVKCNTSNSFINPVDGTDPGASSVFGGSEQVVYNNTGNTVTVTGLTVGTTYWFRVYEANCSGASVKFYTPTASNNPLSVGPYSNSSVATSITASTNPICTGNSTILTVNGGSLGTGASWKWGYNACSVAFDQNWNTQPYGLSSTTQNSVNGILNVSSTTNDPMIDMSGLGSFNPAIYKFIQIRYRVTAGTAGTAEIFFYNTSHGFAVGGESATGALISDGLWHSLSIDMSADPEYTTGGNITGWRFDWSSANAVTMEIDNISLSIGAGSSVSVSPTSNQTYYVYAEGLCNTTACVNLPITVQNSLPAVPYAGPDQYICGATSVTMAATGSGTWAQISGPNTPNIVNTILTTTQIGTVTPLVSGTYVFQWYASNACGISADYIIIYKQ